MRKTWTLPLQFFVRKWILTRKKKIAVIAWAHTMGQWRQDRMAVENAVIMGHIMGHIMWHIMWHIIWHMWHIEFKSVLKCV